jgi:Tfp pilus assembly protein PilO
MSNFWQRLSKRERGLVLLTGLILLVFVGKYAAVSPFLERRQWVQSQLESQPQLLQKNLRYLGQKELLAASLETVRGQIKAQEPKLLTGDTPSVSASDLQETVQAMAAREGTQVITTRVLNPEPAGNFSKIGVQMEIGGQIQQIANLIRGIDSSPKLLVVEDLNVRSLFRPVGLPQPQGLPAVAPQNLRVSLTVIGFARSQAAIPPANGGPAKTNPEKGTKS